MGLLLCDFLAGPRRVVIRAFDVNIYVAEVPFLAKHEWVRIVVPANLEHLEIVNGAVLSLVVGDKSIHSSGLGYGSPALQRGYVRNPILGIVNASKTAVEGHDVRHPVVLGRENG